MKPSTKMRGFLPEALLKQLEDRWAQVNKLEWCITDLKSQLKTQHDDYERRLGVAEKRERDAGLEIVRLKREINELKSR